MRHNRKALRLKGYDYSQPDYYFIIICAQKHRHLFGEFIDGELILNSAGKMIEKWYHILEDKFIHIKCNEMVVMPNHFHAIIQITNTIPPIPVGPDQRVWLYQCVCPNLKHFCHKFKYKCFNDKLLSVDRVEHVGSTLRCRFGWNDIFDCSIQRGLFGWNNIFDCLIPRCFLDCNGTMVENVNYNSVSIATVMQWFKTMTTNEYIRGVKQFGWKPFYKRVWQRSYWDHIIRNENELYRIVNYIRNNPEKWVNDKFNNGDNNQIREPNAIYGEEKWMI